MRSYLWFLLSLMAASAYGQTSCLPAFTSLQTIEIVQTHQPTDIVRPLMISRAGQLIASRAQWKASVSAAHPEELEMSVRFDPEFSGVSLPYTVYSVMVLRDGEPLAWWDYTQTCKTLGPSIFPGEEIHFPRVKLIGDRPQKLQIMLWGRI